MENRQFNRGIHITIKHSFARNVQHLCSPCLFKTDRKRRVVLGGSQTYLSFLIIHIQLGDSIIGTHIQGCFRSNKGRHRQYGRNRIRQIHFSQRFQSHEYIHILQGDLIRLIAAGTLQFSLFQTSLHLNEIRLADIAIIVLILQHFGQLLNNLHILAHRFIHFFLCGCSPITGFSSIDNIIRCQIHRLIRHLGLYLGSLVIVIDASTGINRL